MKRVKLLFSALALVAVSVFGSQAADQDLIIPATQEDAYTPVEVGSGWYIRGDVGINFKGKHSTDNYTLAPVKYDTKYRDALTFGLGAGYRVNDFFRIDAGFETLFNSRFGSRQLVAPQGPCIGRGEYIDLATSTLYFATYNIANCVREDKSSYDALVAMANAYVDLGNYSGFTPFIGAGLGVARVRYSEETASITCVPVDGTIHREGCLALGTIAQPALNAPYTEPGVIRTGADWRLAYSISAGVAYNLSKNLKLDTIYRFNRVAGGYGIPYGSTPGSTMSKDGFSVHQVKMGLRYEIW